MAKNNTQEKGCPGDWDFNSSLFEGGGVAGRSEGKGKGKELAGLCTFVNPSILLNNCGTGHLHEKIYSIRRVGDTTKISENPAFGIGA